MAENKIHMQCHHCKTIVRGLPEDFAKEVKCPRCHKYSIFDKPTRTEAKSNNKPATKPNKINSNKNIVIYLILLCFISIVGFYFYKWWESIASQSQIMELKNELNNTTDINKKLQICNSIIQASKSQTPETAKRYEAMLNNLKEQLKQEMLEQDRAERERLAKEKLEQENLERERLAKIKLEQERAMYVRLAKEKLKREREEQERLAKEKLEREREEQERLAKEKLEREREEQERLNREKVELAEKNKLYGFKGRVFFEKDNSTLPVKNSKIGIIKLTEKNKSLLDEFDRINEKTFLLQSHIVRLLKEVMSFKKGTASWKNVGRSKEHLVALKVEKITNELKSNSKLLLDIINKIILDCELKCTTNNDGFYETNAIFQHNKYLIFLEAYDFDYNMGNILAYKIIEIPFKYKKDVFNVNINMSDKDSSIAVRRDRYSDMKIAWDAIKAD